MTGRFLLIAMARFMTYRFAISRAQISVFSGVADLRKVFDAAKARRDVGQGTLLFVDEIHRFNKAQQDGFLPFVEEGIVTLVGATTENPSFELNNALLSRAQVMVLKALDAPAMALLFRRAEEELQRKLPVSDTGRDALIGFADGDGRYGLNLAEEIFALSPKTDFDADDIAKLLQKRAHGQRAKVQCCLYSV